MDTKITFNTGYTLEFRPVSRSKIAKIALAIESKFRGRNEPLDPPQYYTVEPTETDPNGIKEDHNETTLMTDEDKQAWVLYIDAKNRLGVEQQLKSFDYVLRKGIVTDISPSQEWLDENKDLGIELPDDPHELHLNYLYEEILVSERNIGIAVSRPMVLGLEGLVPDSEVSAIEDTFRGDMESRQEPKEVT